MSELSYSLHIGNDKNKTKNARRMAKTSKSGTTSFSNNAIQNARQLSKVDNHNLRNYDNNKELIETVRGSNDIVEDVKDLYVRLFDAARIKYNESQTRNDRKINDYFEHIAKDDKHDLAVELIIELGDKSYWDKISKEEKLKMVDVYKKQCDDLETIIPNFKIANATIHFDETSPHMHVIGVPYKEGKKNGMYRQVGKASVFTKESLVRIQDEMRERAIDKFNEIYETNFSLKEKEQGRNKDINVKDMNNYSKFKIEQDLLSDEIDRLSENNLKITSDSEDMEKMLNNLEPNRFNKNNYTISKYDKDRLKKYIEEAKQSTNDMLSTANLKAMMDNYERYLKEYTKEKESYKRTIRNQSDELVRVNREYNNMKADYYSLKDSERKAYYETLKLEDKIDKIVSASKYAIEGAFNFISMLVEDGYIPKSKIDEGIEEGLLFRHDKGKWINGKYYTYEMLQELQKQKDNSISL